MRIVCFKYLVLLFSLFSSLTINAQISTKANLSEFKNKNTNKLKTKSRTWFGGFLNPNVKNPSKYIGILGAANSNGMGIGLFYLKPQKNKYSRYTTIYISEIKHLKEEKLKPQLYEIKGQGKPLPYIYGKQNSLFTLSLTYGLSRTLIPSFISPSIDLSLLVEGGFSLAVLKPYYLKLNIADSSNIYIIEDQSYNALSADQFLNPKKIYSKSIFTTGFSEATYIPGFQLSTALLINFNPHHTWHKAIAIGSTVQCFTSSLPILVDANPRYFHPAVFLKLYLAKGW